MAKLVAALALFVAVDGFMAPRAPAASTKLAAISTESMIEKAKADRLAHLEAQSLEALTLAAENYEKAVFPNAMIVGDCVITHLLGKLGYLESGKVKIMVVDTYHLFDSTMPFLESLEAKYKFKAEIFGPADCEDKDVYLKKFGDKLWVADVEQYDKVCKVEPFQRGLKTLETDVMINGRRRDHGAERAYIDIAEGDYKDTVPVPDPDGLSGFQGDAGSVKWVDGVWTGDKAIWLDYGNERKGRFVGLVNKDGSAKTECGIHVAGAEQTFDRDLWESGAVSNLETQESALALKDGVVVVYAPWCQFCQAMEDDYATFADEMAKEGITVAKYRGDEDREFVTANFNTESFPTINLVKDGVATKYDSEARDVESLKKFAMSG
ncbi:phosphoadenylyl-sulfate reductase [Aureococcus anophagefferens]|nr:phosphoadenylyl-sulfate reductase [Aureococcus anophagefferens]